MHGQGSNWAMAMAVALGLASTSARAVLSIDGTPKEDEWQQAQTLGPLVTVQPLTQAAPTHATDVRMLSTADGLAFAFSNLQRAVAPRVKPRSLRDQGGNADRVNVMIDFDGDGKLGYNFMVSLSDSIDDLVIANENQFRPDWDGDWRHAVHETAEGWSVEILIPWSIATMRAVPGATRSIGVYVDRVMGGNGERYAAPAIRFNEPRFLSAFTQLEVKQFDQSILNWYPYVTALADQVHDQVDAKAGIDVFWKPSGSFQLTGALNPDFGQVESDDLVVNFSAQETFFSDKRPFFTENQAFFDLPTAQGGSLIYTRRIGGPRDDGNGVADIDAALKASGSVAGVNYGVFGVLESEHADDIGSAFYAARVQKSGDQLSVGYATTYVDRPFLDRTAFVQMMDLQWNPLSWLRLNTHVIQSQIEQPNHDKTGNSMRAALQFTPSNGLFVEVAAAYLSNDLDLNDMGYMPRNGLHVGAIALQYPYSGFDETSWLRTVNFNSNVVARRTLEGDHVPTRLQVGADLEYRNGATQYVELLLDSSGYDDQIARGNGLVYRESGNSLFTNYSTPRWHDWRLGGALWHTAGGIDMDQNTQLETNITRYFTDTLDLNVAVIRKHTRDSLIWLGDDRFGRFAREQLFTTAQLNWFPAPRHELRAKMQWLGLHSEHARALRLQGNGQLQSSADTIENFAINNFGLQIRYRFEIAPQSDFFAVYSRGGGTFEEREDAGLGQLFERAVELRDADQFVLKIRYRI